MNNILMDILEKIKNKIDNGDNFQPILFLGDNIELLNKNVNSLIEDLIKFYGVDKNYFYRLTDNGEKIKVSQVRDLIQKSNIKPNFKFQVFLIESISRMNNESFSSSLKFLEEPGIGNIVLLTNSSESGIPDTILSRVQIVNLSVKKDSFYSEFFMKLIDDYLRQRNTSIFTYFYDDKKISKEDYLSFLYTFIHYIKTNLVCLDLVSEIEESLNLIKKSNAIAKYEVDKILLKM